MDVLAKEGLAYLEKDELRSDIGLIQAIQQRGQLGKRNAGVQLQKCLQPWEVAPLIDQP